MDEKIRREFNRKLAHIAAGFIFAALIYFEIAGWWHFLILLLVASTLMFYLKKTEKRLPVASHLVDFMGREAEIPGLGAVTFIAGTTIASALFLKDIAAASIIILGVGDAVSPIIGKSIGKTKSFFSKEKNIEGFLAGFILAFAAALPIVSLVQAFLGSLLAMIAEIWEKTDFIDDNILMPLVAGTAMTIIAMI